MGMLLMRKIRASVYVPTVSATEIAVPATDKEPGYQGPYTTKTKHTALRAIRLTQKMLVTPRERTAIVDESAEYAIG
jgi:hypothetical protein